MSYLYLVSRPIIAVLLLLCQHLAAAQKINEHFRLRVKRAPSPVKIDGSGDDPAWAEAETAKDFYMVLPMDSSKARVKTEVRLCFDDKNLYLLAVCHKLLPGASMVESLRRDFNFGRNDNFLVFLDPFEDKTNGFSFGSNAAGAQWDGMMYEGGKVDLNWDNKWSSEVRNEDTKWVFEAAIPFKTLRYRNGAREWGINLSRNDIKVPEKSSWAPVPRQFPTASLAYTGTLVWDEPPPSAGQNISLIPYVLTGTTRDYQKNTPARWQKEIGGDIKIGLTSALNLDLTVNPDFSQVEVDRQVTNLDRFELFFPERRQFFLENGDIFANIGYTGLRPFFSRRIGLEVPIIGGFRVSGKLNKDWRVGIMDMQTGASGEKGLPSQNFAVVALQRKVFDRSNVGIFMINRQSPAFFKDTLPGKPLIPYNRNFGVEYNLASRNNKWTGKLLGIKSFTPGLKGKDWVQAGNLLYSARRFSFGWQHEYVGSQYQADVGYVPRKGYVKINPTAGILFFPRSGRILSHGIRFSSAYYFSENGKHLDDESYIPYTLTFRDFSTFTTWVASNYVYLFQPFDPTNSGKDTLARGTSHGWKAFGTEYASAPQKLFTFSFSTRYGGYYENGTRLNLAGEIAYRKQPYAIFSLGVNYNNIRMPAPWNTTRLWIISPRIDLTLKNNLYFTTFVQYNSQLKNVNINSRLQWRFKPASDVFLVYTDNYLPAPFAVKNRALVLKITYWLTT
jgi:hypothetical protein